MDLEDELRQAMAEHVTGVSAPRTLAHDARRRHQRTVRRRTTFAVAAAGIVVAIAVVPTYQAVHPQQPVGNTGPVGRRTGGGDHGGAAGIVTPAPSSSQRGISATPSATRSGTARPEAKPSSRHPSSGTLGTVPGTVKALLGYLPTGIDPDETCQDQHAGQRRTTTCRWTGPAGWIEVRLVRDDSLTGPADMGFAPPMAEHAQVHGHAALRGTATFAQVMWIERKGLGVWVGVGPGLTAKLMRVAEGVEVR